MSRLLLPLALLLLPLVALASDAAGAPAAQGIPAPAVDYLIGLGPIGALVWGAYHLGRGVRLTVQVELKAEDRALLERGVLALERKVDILGVGMPASALLEQLDVDARTPQRTPPVAPLRVAHGSRS